MTAGLKGIRIALFLVALMLSVSVFVVVPSADVLTSMAIAGGRPVSGDSSSPEPVIETGIIGNISIANIQPVCMIPQSGTCIVPSPSTDTVAVTSQSGEQTSIPVSWFTYYSCALEGSFKARLEPGTYSLTLSYCLQDPRLFGCPQSLHFGPAPLPITVHVERGRLTPVSIGIDTGIR